MSNQEFSEDALESLAREELSDSELRELMERLAASEFGVPERSTVGDVCELTETSPVVVGRILADIRQTSFEELYLSHVQALNRRLDSHEEEMRRHRDRLEDLDRRQRELRSRSMQTVGEEESYFSSIGQRNTGVVVFLLVMSLLIAVIFVMSMAGRSNPVIVGGQTMNGQRYEMSRDGRAYVRRNGRLERASGQDAATAEILWRSSH